MSSNFVELADKLISEETAISSDFYRISKEIETTEQTKADARDRYENVCLDAGDEQGMKACLKTIRDSNKQLENLRLLTAEFPSKVQGLYDKQKELVTGAREHRAEVQAALDRTKKDLEAAEGQVKKCFEILTAVNELNKRVKD